MTQVININLPCNFYFLSDTEVKALDAFALKYKGIFEIQYSSDSNKPLIVFPPAHIVGVSKRYADIQNDFFITFPQFKKDSSDMKQRPSDLFNAPSNAQLAQDIMEKSVCSEREAQERALMKQHGVSKQITYISKDGHFSANSLEKLILLMNKQKAYDELLLEVNQHLISLQGDTDIRDVIEYITSTYTLEKIKE